jgi:restriction system protein
MGSKKSTTTARFSQFLQPTLEAIKDLGGSARPSEVKEWILNRVSLPEKYLKAVNVGGESRFGNDVDWARFYLVRAGYLDASKRGVWSLTEAGSRVKIDAESATQILRENRGADENRRHASAPWSADAEPYIEATLIKIRALPPKGLESLCQRLLQLGCFRSEQQLVSEAIRLLKREREETLEGIRRGLADAAADQTQPLAEAFSDIRREFNLPDPS